MISVLISIRPRWCELIASGQKTVEVRKTRPKIATPFKSYIYCTMGKSYGREARPKEALYLGNGEALSNGKVIGEFICDEIFPLSFSVSPPGALVTHYEVPNTGLSDVEIMEYLGNGKTGYGWHISELTIYDRPLELFKFFGTSREAWPEWDFEIPRPPQSWRYVLRREETA